MFTYGSGDSQRPPIRISDWLIFFCGNLMIHQKETKLQKHKFYDEKKKTNKQTEKVDASIK